MQTEYERTLYENLVSEYLRLGSVDKIFEGNSIERVSQSEVAYIKSDLNLAFLSSE